MAGYSWLLFVCVLLEGGLLGAAQQQDQWSGLVNDIGSLVDYTCPNNSVLTGIASNFSGSDRRWEFRCGDAARVASTLVSCTLQPPINTLQEEISYFCPDGGYLGGFRSEFTASRSDRIWEPYCCMRPASSLINCQIPTRNYQNNLRANLNVSAPEGFVLVGMQSFYFSSDRRWRYQTCQIEVSCGDPGVPTNALRFGDQFLYTDNVTYVCEDGFYQSSGPVGGVRECLITGEWSSTQPVCSRCEQIENCAQVICTNSSDHYCMQCASNNGPQLGARAYTNLGDQCQARCSWLRAFCFPGVCPDTPGSCTCLEGFQGPDCLQISDRPELSQCLLDLEDAGGQLLRASCRPANETSRLFTNIHPHLLLGEWNMLYVGPALSSLPDFPAYVGGYEVGVAVAEMRTSIYRAANPLSAVSQSVHRCTPYSENNPQPGVNAPCRTQATPTSLANHTFLHGDMFEVIVRVAAGGYLDITDLDTNISTRYFYEGTPTEEGVVFILDLYPPVHCSLESPPTCIGNAEQSLLTLSGEVVSQGRVTASWGGWRDVPSRVQGYELIVYMLGESGGMLREGQVVQTFSHNHTDGVIYEQEVWLPGEGPYSFVLETLDEVGNIRFSRRLVLFDNSSVVNIDPSRPLTVISAVPQTNFQWQNSTDQSILISGQGHFFNSHFLANDLLAPVGNLSGSVQEEYDHPLTGGQYPRGGTLNALGIVSLYYDYIIDQVGGTSTDNVTAPETFRFQSTDIGIEEVSVSVPVQDGDSVRIWFMAEDFKSQQINDSVLLHVDSSSPLLSSLTLVWNGVTGLSLHGTETLTNLNIQFDTSDPHSGIMTLEWNIGTGPGLADVGYGNIPVSRVEGCEGQQEECVCDVLGRCVLVRHIFSPLQSNISPSALTNHDATYHITITTTNHAYLSSTTFLTFTIDTTPPLQGVVFDAPPGHPDVDYQTSSALQGWWRGFFDRETGISFYQYLFARECANSSYFSFPLMPGSGVVETNTESAIGQMEGEGTYYLTVVGWNAALSPSDPVCSDGLTVDMTPPVFEGVSIPGARVEGGLVWVPGEEVWVVGRDRTRRLVRGGRDNDTCTGAAAIAEDLSSYFISEEESLSVDVCFSTPPLTSSPRTVITQDHTLNITWQAYDNIGIRDFYIGILHAQDYTRNDTENVTGILSKTAGLSHFSMSDSTILVHGSLFYLVLRGEDLAGLSTTLTVGPVLIDQTPPLTNGSLYVQREVDHVIIMWDVDTFTDEEEGESSITLQYAIGLTRYGEEVISYMPLPQNTPSTCPSPTTNCFSIDPSSQPTLLLTGQSYYFTLAATNQAGLSSLLTSSYPYRYDSAAPTAGLVLDIDFSAAVEVVEGSSYHREDIDIILEGAVLGVRWTGFAHHSLLVNLYVSLGSVPGVSDVVSSTAVGVGVNQYIFQQLPLVEGVTYYSTVTAETILGRVNASSNGVLFLGNLTSVLPQAVVFDGLGIGDMDYQTSTSHVSAQWLFPYPVHTHISHYMWRVVQVRSSLDMESQPVGSASASGNGEEDEVLQVIEEFVHVGRDTSGVLPLRGLEAGGVHYRNVIRACVATKCLPPVYSNGFYISSPPSVGAARAIYSPLMGIDAVFGTSSQGRLVLRWRELVDPELAYYEWRLVSDVEQLVPWKHVDNTDQEVSVILNVTLSLHRSISAQLRGYNYASLHATSTAELEWNIDGIVLPQDLVPRSPLQVLDVSELPPSSETVTDWRGLRYKDLQIQDIDYINTTSLSGVWPHLRYMTYNYSVSALQAYTPCFSTASIACGSTFLNHASIKSPRVQDGQTYYFCVRALLEHAIHPTSATPAVLEVCSNGVTVDLSAPQGSCFKIISPSLEEIGGQEMRVASGNEVDIRTSSILDCTLRKDSLFQASNSELHFTWSNFMDTSRVAYYSYAIGTGPYSTAVTNYTSVEVASSIIVRGLSLQSGATYYATLQAVDYAGHTTYLVSRGATIDRTPPIIIGVCLEHSDQFRSELSVEWTVIHDGESGISDLEWALGSRPGSSDIAGWSTFVWGAGTSVTIDTQDLSLYEGQLVFASLKVKNGAGLVSVKSSLGDILDSSPPEVGVVFDGAPESPSSGGLDVEYWNDVGVLSAHWTGFSEPHSVLVGYWWAIGSCPGCTDTQPFLAVGLQQDATRSGLSLSHGGSYYMTVRACNSLDMCSQATSNGVTVDATPPTSGRVYDGPVGGADIQYQPSLSVISAHWLGFHDSQSSLCHFIFFAGSSPNSSDIVSLTTLPSTYNWHAHRLSTPLREGSQVFTTVVAYNKAGLSTWVSSNGVVIDNTSPMSHANPVIRTSWVGSSSNSTQFSSSSLRVEWNYTDNSAMQYYYMRLESDAGTYIPIPPQSAFLQSSLSFSRLMLSDGSVYRAVVRGCDAAGICLTSLSDSVLVDSSPPIDGYFAVEGSNFNRSLQTWRNRPVRGVGELNIGFFGFSDPHSQVVEYWAHVGSRLSTADLMEPSLLATTQLDNDPSSYILTATITLNRLLNESESIFVSMWAVNSVGLRSHVVQASFTVQGSSETNRGNLVILRSPSCQIVSCLGHCSCAARGDLCNVPLSLMATCEPLSSSSLSPNMQVQVFNDIPQLLPSTMAGNNIVTSITDKLFGRWTINGASGNFQRLEWTVGLREPGAEPGYGLIDTANDIVWRDPGIATSAVFTVSDRYPLMDGETYVFYVRVWYSSERYAIFASDGVSINTRKHQVPRGRRVADVRGGGVTDVDFTTDSSSLSIAWDNVFMPTLAGNYSTYEVGFGDVPGSDNVYPLTSVISTATSYSVSGLTLQQGVEYYGIVRAINPLGEITTSISDGVRLDLIPPSAGVVLGGRGMMYATSRAQVETDRFSVRWFGFSDPESGIHHYELALTNSTAPPQQYNNMGISLGTTLSRLTLAHGQTYYAHVVAVNGAGFRSRDVTSEGVVIQTLRPIGRMCDSLSSNVLANPSFENNTVTSIPCPQILLNVAIATNGWDVDASYITLASYPQAPPTEGCFSVGLIGTISQSFPSIPGTLYTLTFSYTNQPRIGKAGVRVQLPGLDRLLLSPYNEDEMQRWHKGRIEFRADNSVSHLSLSSGLSNALVFLDDISITSCNQYSVLTTTALPQAILINPSVISGSKVRLTAEWSVVDEVCGVKEYLWAIGTVPGGEQLQMYESTGPEPRGTSKEVIVKHGQELHVSVVAWSNAGRELLVHSGTRVVDLTSPGVVFEGGVIGDVSHNISVWDGTGEMDVDYQASLMVGVNWRGLSDQESALENCAWAIGSVSGWSDVQNYFIINLDSSQDTSMTSDLSGVLEHGSVVYSTLVCSNKGYLISSATTDGLTILIESPSNENAYALVSSPAYTQYAPRDGYIPTSALTLRWGGFNESAGTSLVYEVRILEEGLAGGLANWTSFSTTKMLTISDLQVSISPAVHVIEVRAVNLAGIYSDPVSVNFSIVPFPPQETGIPINASWTGDSILELDWSEAFTSSIPMYYELSIGIPLGSGYILKWVELSSLQTSYRGVSSFLFRDMDYFVSLTAISSTGLHATTSQLISGVPISGL